MLEINQAARYFQFIKWMKTHHKAYYILYGMHVSVPGADLRININMDYVQPEDKKQLSNILGEFNSSFYD